MEMSLNMRLFCSIFFCSSRIHLKNQTNRLAWLNWNDIKLK